MNNGLLDRSLLPAGSRVLCAVSGGADSMCLLHLLFTLQAELGIEVCAAHFEHGLRGEESLRDARFVEAWCAERGIPFRLGHGDVRAYAAEKSLGVEEAAREKRYAFLEDAAAELGCGLIATAHNADDNAETVLFNLARGSGAAGLRGIPPKRGHIIRPLLGVTRAEIERCLEENGIDHVEDSTNSSDDYSRNLIRHRVLPQLRRINPDCSAAVGRAAALLRQDEDCLTEQARRFIEKYYDGESLPAAELGALHRAVSSRVVRLLSVEALSAGHVEAVLRLSGSGGLAYADLPGRRVRYEQGRVYFASDGTSAIKPRRIVTGECTDIVEAGVRIRAAEGIFEKEINGLFKTYCFKCDSICGNIFCTGRQPGDRLHPAGRNCGKTLKSLFTEAGMTQRQRDLTPVLRDDRGILAAVPFAQDRRTVPAVGDRVLRIEIEKL